MVGCKLRIMRTVHKMLMMNIMRTPAAMKIDAAIASETLRGRHMLDIRRMHVTIRDMLNPGTVC